LETLIDRLKTLGVTLGSTNIKSRERFPIEKVISGEWLHDPLGDVFQVSEEFLNGYQHGGMNLDPNFSFSRVLKVSGLPNDGVSLEHILFMDTETTGLSGGTGTMAFLVGLGYFSENGFIIDQFFLDDPVNEIALLNEVSNVFSHYKVLATFNGSSFDIPLLKARFILNRMNSPFQNKSHLDLLHLSRKIWKLRLASLKLRDLENEILDFKREENEVPGWLVPQIYFDFIRSRDARPLKGVFYHNRMDVFSLALLFNLASDLISEPLENSQAPKEDMLSIARMIEDHGFSQQSMTIYEAICENGMPENLSAQTLLRFGFICRRHHHFDLAIKFWMSSYEKGEYKAAIEISKILEYKRKDLPNALLWAKSGVDLLRSNNGKRHSLDSDKGEINKRIDRLEVKIRKKHEKN
jgi:uncharacterized protein